MKRLLLLALIAPASFGYQLSSLSVETAYKTSTVSSFITSPYDVITGEEIEEKKPFFLNDILQNKAGISFSSNGGFGQITSLYLWGMEPKRTLTLIEGIRVNDFTTPNISASYEHILLEDINRIEIIKGTQSGVWGADAAAGVINIITKQPEEGLRVKLYGLTGSYSTQKEGLRLSFRNTKGYILLSYLRFKTLGFSAVEPTKDNDMYGKRWDELGFEKDPYKNETLSLKTKWNITENDTFQTYLRTVDAVVHYDSVDFVSGKPVDAPDGPFTLNHSSQKFFKFQYDKKINNNRITLLASKSKFKRSQYGGYEGEYREYTVKDRFDYLQNGFVLLGASRQDFIHQKSGGTALNRRYHNYGYYLTNVVKVKKTVLSQSIRHDSYSSFKDKTTWKLGIKQSIFKNLYISGNWGTAYNVPTIDQLYNPWWGNKNLTPENTLEWDVSVGYKSFSLTYFNQKVKNLIDYDFSTYKYKNFVGKSKINGIETKYSRFIEPLKLFLSINYTYLDAKKPDGSKLPRRPQNKIGFDVVFYPDENVILGFSGIYIGKRKDTDGAKTGYYTVINSYFNVRVSKNIEAYLKLNNITDTYYQTVDGYATEGRSVYAGVDLTF